MSYGAITDAPNVRAEISKYLGDLKILQKTVGDTKPKLLTLISQKDRLMAHISILGTMAQNVVSKSDKTLEVFDIDSFRNDVETLLDNVATYMAEMDNTKGYTGLISNVSFELSLVAMIGLIIYWIRRKR